MTEGRKLAGFGEPIIGFAISPLLGRSAAGPRWVWLPRMVRHQTVRYRTSATTSDWRKDCPSPVTPDQFPAERTIVSGGAENSLGQISFVSDAQAAMGNDASKFILMRGHAEWKDIFSPKHQIIPTIGVSVSHPTICRHRNSPTSA